MFKIWHQHHYVVVDMGRLGKPSFVKKKIFCEIISLTGGGVWLISYLYFIFLNTLQTHFKHPATPFKHP